MKENDFLSFLRKRLKRGRIIESGGSRCDKLFPRSVISSLGDLRHVPTIGFPAITFPVIDITDVMAHLSALAATARSIAPTMQEFTDAVLALQGLPCYYPPLRPRPRPKPRRSRARHRPTRLQRRRGRQAKRKTRK
jgi:hypothetical protein